LVVNGDAMRQAVRDANAEETFALASLLISQLVNGLVLGFLYILIAIGLSLVFGILGIVNFAHGAFFALGAYFALTVVEQFGWPAVLLAPIGVAVIGMLCELVLIRRLYREQPLTGLIVTFALALLIEAVIRSLWGPNTLSFSPPAALRGFFEIGPAILTSYRLAVIVVTVLFLLIIWMFFELTPYGRILRAGSRDPEMLAILGINFPRVMTGAFGLACFMAGAAGLLAGPLWSVSPFMSASAIMPAFVVVTIGGLGSYKGAVVASLLLGVVTSLTVEFLPSASGAAMYVLMAIVILLRPRGLFGETWERFE
jgi:branched-chain amino acid transport system permease protein